jgi:uncharacterized protein (DUF1778 family)
MSGESMDTTITFRADKAQKELISEYAKLHDTSMSNFILQTILDRIEDEIDLRDMEEAISEFKADPITHTHDDIKREFGLA